jgi:hypothetical protein
MPSKEEYWRNPVKFRELTRRYNLDHPEWKRETDREWMKKLRSTPEGLARSKTTQERYRKKHQQERQAATTKWARERRPGYWLLKNAQYRAKKLGLPFNLDWEDIKIPEFCPVLGIRIVMLEGRKGFSPNSPSIDRIVPVLGYVKTNVRVISNKANCIKRDATLEELEAIVAYVKRETGAS